MIHRIVKLNIREEERETFIETFNAHCEKIRHFPGCKSLRLQAEVGNSVFFTYSLWENDEALQNYRNSELFGIVSPALKSLFADRAMAWSTEVIKALP